MRLITSFSSQQDVAHFTSALYKKNIRFVCEKEHVDQNIFQIWILSEDDLKESEMLLEIFHQDRLNPLFAIEQENTLPTANRSQTSDDNRKLESTQKSHQISLTKLTIILCSILYILNFFSTPEKGQAINQLKNPLKAVFTPINFYGYYDLPFIQKKSLSNGERSDIVSYTTWQGAYKFALDKRAGHNSPIPPLFIKIREGQIWRTFTPALLHGSFFHIFFNMLWLAMLGKQIEERVKYWKYCTLIIIIGVISNTCQYLMSGPFFIGYSGIISGLVGFIWMRQRAAPWESYPLQKDTIRFFTILVLIFFSISAISFISEWFGMTLKPLQTFLPNIGNTAHISGAITGALLAKIPIFKRDWIEKPQV